jgi:heme/copper-type cytochrome/quinol oxidase subunit 2
MIGRENYGGRPTPALVRARPFAALLLLLLLLPVKAQQASRVIEVTAGHDSRYKIQGMSTPSITVTANEKIILRVTAIRAKQSNRDGSIHGFSLLRPKDHQPVPGWELLLKPGVQEFALTAPAEPGEYQVVCTVICSEGHEQMNMKFIVEPEVAASLDSEIKK